MAHRRALRLRAIAGALMALVLGSALLAPASAYAENRTDGPRTWHVRVGEQSPDGAIQGMAFLPGTITIDVGDTVHWTADSLEPHTVSFLDASHPLAPFDPSIAYMVDPTPQQTVEPGQFRSSGIMATMSVPDLPPAIQSYDLKFTKAGDYTYVCFVHGRAMTGYVHVNPAGTSYPFTQAQYDRMALRGQAAVIADGRELWAEAREGSTNHHVFVGAADMTALLMRFVDQKVTVRVGDTVTFDLKRDRFPVPHTVTFGPEPPSPFVPVGDPTHFTGGALSSGLLLPAPFGIPNVTHDTFAVTFATSGTYHYVCMLHDGMGMTGTVVVRPASDDANSGSTGNHGGDDH